MAKIGTDKRDFEIKIRVTADERQKLRDLAHKADLSVADFVRFTVFGSQGLKKTSIPHFEHYQTIMRSLNPISSNFNQIAKHLNERRGKDVDEDEIFGFVENLNDRMRLFYKEMKDFTDFRKL